MFIGSISACNTFKKIPDAVEIVVPVPTPVLVPKAVRPILAISELTEAQMRNDGEVVKAYIASLHQMIDYADLLEKIIETVE